MELNDLLEDNTPVIDIELERKIAINSIISTEYVQGLRNILSDITLLESPLVRTIVTWAIHYFKEYNKCIDSHIVEFYEHEKKRLSETQSKDIHDFLESINDLYITSHNKLHNPLFDLELAREYINVQKVKKLHDNLGQALLTNNVTKAGQYIANFTTAANGLSGAVNGLEDFSRLDRIKNDVDSLFYPRGEFKKLYGPIRRKQVSYIGAKAKVGKSREMVWLTCEALRNGLSVFVATLEMTEDAMLTLIDQEMMRMWMFDGKAKIPRFVGEKEELSVEYDDMEITESTPQEIINGWKTFKQFNNGSKLYVKAWQQYEATISEDIIPELDIIQARDGAVDFIMIDYADLLKTEKEDMRKEHRLQIASKTQAIKKLAQARNVHVHSGTQMDDNMNARESYTKAADVDIMIALVQSPNEKKAGVYRQYVTFHRWMLHTADRPFVTVSNNSLGLFNLDGRWGYTKEPLNGLPDDPDFELFTPYNYYNLNELDEYL